MPIDFENFTIEEDEVTRAGTLASMDVALMLQGHKESREAGLTRQAAAFLRAAVHAANAAIEGFLAHQKHNLLVMAGWGEQAGTPYFTRAELAFLKEEEQVSFQLNDRGEATERTRPLGVRFRDNVRFTVTMMGRACGFPLEWDDPKWKALLALIEVRDRITHPRSPRDMDLEESVAETVRAALTWLGNRQVDATVALFRQDARQGQAAREAEREAPPKSEQERPPSPPS